MTAIADNRARRAGPEKEEQILDAAKAAFMELGYAGTSMDLVAQQARVSKTTLYTRYPSKQALFAATITRECQRYEVMLPDSFYSLPVAEALGRIAKGFLTLVCSPAAIRVYRIVIAESERFPELAQIFHDSGPEPTKCAIGQYMGEAARRGLLDIDDPHFAACQFIVSLQGELHFEAMLGVRPIPSEAEIDIQAGKAVDFFLKGALPR